MLLRKQPLRSNSSSCQSSSRFRWIASFPARVASWLEQVHKAASCSEKKNKKWTRTKIYCGCSILIWTGCLFVCFVFTLKYKQKSRKALSWQTKCFVLLLTVCNELWLKLAACSISMLLILPLCANIEPPAFGQLHLPFPKCCLQALHQTDVEDTPTAVWKCSIWCFRF